MSGSKTIRIWNGCKVVAVISVAADSHSVVGNVGGAANSGKVDIELDPFAGLIVDHSANRSPVDFREAEL